MKIDQLLAKDTLSLSFEVFPPKADTAFENVKKATEEIAALGPAFVSVTYGAGGGTSRYTLDIAKNIKDRFGVSTLAHLTCVSSTKETVQKQIEDIKAAGIQNVMALRGDLPEHMKDADRADWEYRYAIDLIRQLRESDADFCIGGACYPEIHPESHDQKEDIKHSRENTKLFPGVRISDDVDVTSDISQAVEGAEVIINVLPFIAVRDVIEILKPIYNEKQIILSATKGIDEESFITSTKLLEEGLGAKKIAALSGPSFASEIVNGDNISFM